jgi:hypothetical protein
MLPEQARSYTRALFTVVLMVFLALGLGLAQLTAQDGSADAPPEATADPVPTAEPTPVLLVSVSGSEPAQVLSGSAFALSVFGANFTTTTLVRLVGFGLLDTSLVNSGALRAQVPASVPPGRYTVEVTDPERGSALSPVALTLVAPQQPVPTAQPQPTSPPPTPLPGQPSLVVRNYSASPAVVAPGGTVTLTLEVVNQGSRTAQGVSAAVDPGGKIVPASGQASALLPDIGPGGTFVFTLAAVAALDTPAGPTGIALTLAYYDFEGQAYTDEAALTVTVQRIDEASQVTLARYMISPTPVQPGERVTVTVLVMNSGNETARQVLLRVATSGSDGVLLAGPQGDSFPLGDLAPGQSASLDLPLVVSSAAKAGPQAQPVTISYLQAGESKEVTSSMTVNVAQVAAAAPLLLLDAYDTGADVLQPGDRFTLTMAIRNAGAAAAANALVTFGSVETSSSPPPSGGGDGSPGPSSPDTGSGSSSTSVTPSTTFAPLGTGDTLYLGALPGGDTVTVTQEFIINGTADSGIYNLPVTLRYTRPDNSSGQDSLRVSVVVVAPPRLQITLQGEVPDTVNTGEPLALSWQVRNLGRKSVNLTFARVTASSGEVLDGAEVFAGTLRTDEDIILNAAVMPADAGPLTVTLSLSYLDDLNQEQVLVETLESEAVSPPPLDAGPPPDVTPPPAEEPQDDGWLGRLLLGLLGLGS